MDNGTTGRFSRGPRSILDLGYAAGCVAAELRDHCRAAFLDRQFLPVISVTDTRRQGVRIPALGSLPNLRRHLAPTARSRLSRGRLQGKVSPAIEIPALEVVTWAKRGPVDQTPLTSLSTLSTIRALVAGLILVALIPNLTLGAIFWLGGINAPWFRPATHPPNESSGPAAQSAVPSPVLSSPAMLEATAGGDITFPIALDGTDGVPARSIIAVKGLPRGSKLSSGRPYDETEWNLKPDEIGDLHLILPSNASGEAKLIIQLVATDGAIIADAATLLKTPTNSVTNIGASDAKTEPTVVDEPAEARGTTGAEERLANLDAAMETPGDLVPLPLRRPAQTSNDDANSITLTSVNLRERPTRSAPALGVVAKGTKLRLIGRKRSWVQVTNLETSEEGWIYARNVVTVR